MLRLAVVVMFLFSVASAQTSISRTVVVRDPQAVTLLQQSIAAMANGVPVSDVTLSGTAIRIAGSDQESGQLVLEAKGTQESKLSLSVSTYVLTEVRNFTNGVPGGRYTDPDGSSHELALHNCFTDAAWFFPLLSSIASTLSDATVSVSYVGQESLSGQPVRHVTVWQSPSSGDALTAQSIVHLSTVDWYLDSSTSIPLAVRFTTHPPENSSLDMAVEIRFSNYQLVNGSVLPFHIQKFLNGGLVLDLTISSATLNSGIPDSDFVLQ